MPGHFGGSTSQGPAGGASAGGNYGGNSSGGVSANNISGAGDARERAISQQYSQPTTTSQPTGGGDAREIAISQQYTKPTAPAFDYETEAYTSVPSSVIPQFDQKGKFTGLTATGEGVITSEDYQKSNIEGYLLDATINDKDKIELLNQLQGIANSKYDVGKPRVDDEAKQFIQDNLESVLDRIKSDPFYEQYTKEIDPESATYVDTFRDKPLSTFAKSGFSLTGVVLKSAEDAFKNQKALDALGYTGTALSPNYAETGGGLLSRKDYLTGQTLGGSEVSEAISQLPGLISGTELPPSVFQTFFSDIGQAGADIVNRYNEAKQNLNTIAFAPTNSLSYGIFTDAKLRGLI